MPRPESPVLRPGNPMLRPGSPAVRSRSPVLAGWQSGHVYQSLDRLMFGESLSPEVNAAMLSEMLAASLADAVADATAARALEGRLNEMAAEQQPAAAASYKLSLKLPYTVEEDKGTAKFDKSSRTLIVTLALVHDIAQQ